MNQISEKLEEHLERINLRRKNPEYRRKLVLTDHGYGYFSIKLEDQKPLPKSFYLKRKIKTFIKSLNILKFLGQ